LRIGIEGRALQGERYGVARYLANLVQRMVEIDESHCYIIYHSAPVKPLEIPSPALEYRLIKMRPSLLWRHLRLPLAMRQDHIDLHFSPSYFLPLIKVCPYVVVVHDLIIKAHPQWFAADRRFRFDDFFWREVRKAERIITVSEYSKGDVVRFLKVDPAKVAVIHEAADDAFRPTNDTASLTKIRGKYGLPENFIFTVGAIHTRRNLERLIQAVSLAERGLGQNLTLLILGSPAPFSPPVDIWGVAHRCGLDGRVLNMGYLADEELRLLYNACGLFIYPSLYEGFGLPVIEAMACGAPVACSGVTSLPEVAGEAAVFFDPTSVEEMAETIVSVLGDDRLRKKLTEAGIKRASCFSWYKAARETLEVFEEAVG